MEEDQKGRLSKREEMSKGNLLKGRNVKGRQYQRDPNLKGKTFANGRQSQRKDNLKGKPIQFVLNYFYIATFIVIETASRNPAYF